MMNNAECKIPTIVVFSKIIIRINSYNFRYNVGSWIVVLFFFLTLSVAGQTVVNKTIYKVNFSNKLHVPRYVSYYLYKGGGNCKRDKFDFKNDNTSLSCACDSDYKGNKVYDKGHLANAEDFAFDCDKEELTFRYYNCLPQTTSLNRGVWKSNEVKIRKWSQNEKLYIVCGGYFEEKRMGRIVVPSYCWKVVQSVQTKKILFCGWFSNTYPASVEEISIDELNSNLKSKVVLLK